MKYNTIKSTLETYFPRKIKTCLKFVFSNKKLKGKKHCYILETFVPYNDYEYQNEKYS
jgi:hypothetical protein